MPRRVVYYCNYYCYLDIECDAYLLAYCGPPRSYTGRPSICVGPCIDCEATCDSAKPLESCRSDCPDSSSLASSVMGSPASGGTSECYVFGSGISGL